MMSLSSFVALVRVILWPFKFCCMLAENGAVELPLDTLVLLKFSKFLLLALIPPP